jgi:enoyl-CoA hydratase/carnithine racemase
MSESGNSLVLSEVRSDGVATLRLNGPPMNALSKALLTEIGDAASSFAENPDVKAVVVLGGEKAFAAGADISEFGGEAEAREIGAIFRRAFDAIAAIPRPVIAAVGGFALGGGLELALACDLRILGDKAKVGQPEILLGIIPGAGGTQRLTRLIGPARAKELIWSGRQVGADEALALGIADKVVPNAELESSALAWASELASGPSVAMGLAKHVINAGLDRSLSEGLDGETAAFIEVFATEDAATGVRSFLEHGPGKAEFRGK